MKIYVVNEGDTLQSIAERFQVSIERLAFDNEIQRQELVLGQALLILEPEQIYTIEKRGYFSWYCGAIRADGNSFGA